MGDNSTPSGSDLPLASSSYPGPGSIDAQQTQNPARTDVEIQTAYIPSFYGNPQPPFNAQFDMAQPQGPARPGIYNMAVLANALPQANYRQGLFNPSQLRYNPPGASPNMVGQTQAMPQYSGQGAMGQMPNQTYYMQQQAQMSPYYGSPLSPSHPQSNTSQRANMPYYGNQVIANQQPHPSMAYYYAQMPPHPPQGQPPPNQGMQNSFMPMPGNQLDSGIGTQQTGDSGSIPAFVPTQEPGQLSIDSRSSIVRGPPRKPRQSGYAIWIGNLPSQADLMSLVHHVCQEAEGLESLFLISKSNCAFANYKDETSCLAAQQKLHESKFQSVRLVSRLRKNTVEGASGVTAPTGPSGTTPHQITAPELTEIPAAQSTEIETSRSEAGTPSVPETKAPPVGETGSQKDKFYILKSLTVEDLELSVRTGIWATQAHNEASLNTAFQTSENVYLVFSANKSGEYFGYARMVSTINDDPAAAIEFAPKAQSVSDVDLPKEIPTEPTDTTPRGRIIDDSARGTIFWEVVREDSVEGTDSEDITAMAGEQDNDSSTGGEGGSENKTWGKPFKLEWLCTTRLPFYRCRGLRNPWNSNREVKIARDGTELEPSVGRRLIGLFNRNHNSPAPRGPIGGGYMSMPPPQQPTLMGYPPHFQ